MNARFDVLVLGAGPAGIAAALSAAASGMRVGLVDDNPVFGGQIWRNGGSLPTAARRWLDQLAKPSLTRLQGCRVFDHLTGGTLRAECNGDCHDLHYEKLILATGARERFLPFPGWTLPNVMGAGGLDAMVRGGLPIAGKRVVVAGTGPLLLAVAAHLARRGAEIVAISEQASLNRLLPFTVQLLREPAKLWQGIAYGIAARGARLYTSCWVVAANGTKQLEWVTLQQKKKRWDEGCDYLACGYHLIPNLELPALLGCRIENGFVVTDRLQQTSTTNVFCAGEPTGIGGVEMALLEGQIAGFAATGRIEEAEKLARRRRGKLDFVQALRAATSLNPQLKCLSSDATIVCRCEDVPFGALREHTAWRDAKLHTRCGMGPCQGRICGAATEFLFGWDAVTTDSGVRPPIFPTHVSSLAFPDKLDCRS